MIKLFTLLTLGVLFVAFTELQARRLGNLSQGNGDLTTTIREASDFKFIVFTGQGTLFVKQGDQFRVEVETLDHIQAMVRTTVEDDMLIIKLVDDIEVDQLNVSITLPILEGIIFDGDGRIFSDGKLESTKLNLKLDGKGLIKMDVKVSELISVVNGTGDIYLMGSADAAQCEINGRGDLKLEDLSLNDANIEINGSGKARVTVRHKLSVSINGIGDVEYLGEPEMISQFIEGSGKLISID